MMIINELEARQGTAFTMRAGQHLVVIDPLGEQVADLLAFPRSDPREYLSSGRTLDYAESIRLTTGNLLYSNRSRPLLEIVRDDVGVHDFLLTPCSHETFELLYDPPRPLRGCYENFVEALAPFGIAPDQIPIAFNCFMNVRINPVSGKISVEPPVSRAGQSIEFRALTDLIVAITACSAPQSNNGTTKPIHFSVTSPDES